MTTVDFDRFHHLVWHDGVVYRAYREDGALLYVGCTSNLRKRLSAHRGTAQWWDEAAWLEVEPQVSLRLAQLIERHQIAALAPLYNRVANFRRGWDYERNGSRGTRLVYLPERDQFRERVAA